MELPNGTYAAKAKRAQLGESSTGKEQISIYFELAEPAYEGTHLTYYGYFTTDKAIEFSHKALRVAGWKGTDTAELIEGVDLANTSVELVVENEEYNGKTRAKIKFINTPGGGARVTPMAPDKARSFAAKMKAKFASLDASAGMKPKLTMKPSAQPDSDSPFND